MIDTSHLEKHFRFYNFLSPLPAVLHTISKFSTLPLEHSDHVTTFWRHGLLQYRKVPFGTNPSSREREKQIINEDWKTCFNSIHRRCVAGCSSWKLMRDFFCYKMAKKRKGNWVEARRNILRFTCDFVANERDTTVIILPQIVCVLSWGLGAAIMHGVLGRVIRKRGKV